MKNEFAALCRDVAAMRRRLTTIGDYHTAFA
jgi:hypothetical protein